MMRTLYTYLCEACGYRGEFPCELTGGLGVHCREPMRVISTRTGTVTLADDGRLMVEEDRRSSP